MHPRCLSWSSIITLGVVRWCSVFLTRQASYQLAPGQQSLISPFWKCLRFIILKETDSGFNSNKTHSNFSLNFFPFWISFLPMINSYYHLKECKMITVSQKGKNPLERRLSVSPLFFKRFKFIAFLFLLPLQSQFWKARQTAILTMIGIILFQEVAPQVSHWEIEIAGK